MAAKNCFFSSAIPKLSTLAFVYTLVTLSPLYAQTSKCEIYKKPVTIVASGGTSLGAYQAGAYRRILDAVQNKSQNFEIKLLAGASAGGINSILALQDHCGTLTQGQKTNWLEDFWTAPMGKELFEPGERLSILNSATPFRKLESQFQADWKNSKHACDLVLSIPLTLQTPLKINVTGTSPTNYQFLGFSMRVKPGSPANIENHANIFESPLVPLLDIPQDQTAKRLLELAHATAALPLIFNPEQLPYCLVSRNNTEWMHERPPFRCSSKQVLHSAFMDGALLESAPLSTAHKLLSRGLQARCDQHSFEWLEIPTDKNSRAGADLSLIINLNVNNRGETQSSLLSVAGGLSKLFGDLLQSAREKDAIELLENNPDLKSQVLSLSSSLPRWSEEWNGFFGFFDAEFRSFDYWLGYAEMDQGLKTSYPNLYSETKRTLKPLARCLLTWMDSKTEPHCVDLTRNESLLLGIILRERERECLNSQAGTALCLKIAKEVPRANKIDSNKHSRFAVRMTELDEGAFEFSELGLRRNDSLRAPSRVKSWLTRSAGNLTEVFPEDSSTSLAAVSEFLLGTSDPIPSLWQAHMLWGSSFEVGYSHLLQPNYMRGSAWRWPLVFELYGPRILRSEENSEIAGSLYSGIEFEKLQDSMQTWLLSFRVGYQMSSMNSSGLCRNGQVELCQGLSLEPSLALLFFGRFRLQAGIKMSFTEDLEDSATAGIFTGGIQF